MEAAEVVRHCCSAELQRLSTTTPSICCRSQKTLDAGDLETADAAVHALWLLVKGNRRLLRPEAQALGVAGTQLVKPLWDIILSARASTAVRPTSAAPSAPIHRSARSRLVLSRGGGFSVLLALLSTAEHLDRIACITPG